MPDERDADIIGGEAGGHRRVPPWLRRAFYGIAVVAVAVLVGRELVAAPNDRGDHPRPPSWPTPTDPVSWEMLRPERSLVGMLDGRIVRIQADGTVRRGPRLTRPAGVSSGDRWVWWNRRVQVHLDGRILYIENRMLLVAKRNLSGAPRTVTDARRVLPCQAGGTCIETDDGAVAEVRLSDGKIMDPEVVPREAYADGGWRPWAMLEYALVVVRPAQSDRRPANALPSVDVAVVPKWDDQLHVLAENVRLLGARHSQILVWQRQRSGPGTLVSYAVNDAVQAVAPSTVPPPPGARFLPEPAAFLGLPGAVVHVATDDTHELAFVEPYGGEEPASILPGSRGADADAGLAPAAGSGANAVVFGDITGGEIRFGLATVSGSQPFPRVSDQGVSTRFSLLAVQDCLPRTCVTSDS